MKKIEKIYVIIALIFGVIMVIITPPFTSPDEDNHFKKAHLISEGNLYPIVEDEVIGNYYSSQALHHFHYYVSSGGVFDKKFNYADFLQTSLTSKYMDYSEKTFDEYPTSKAFPLAYIGASIGIIIAKTFAIFLGYIGLGPGYYLMFARLFSLLLAIFITYNAIKITPVLKRTMTAVALMPMTLFLYASVTYDNLLISLSLLALAVMLDLIYNKKIKKINWKYLLILTIIGIFLLNVKTIYSVIFILVLFIPKEKFGGMKNKIIKYSIVSGIVLAVTVLWRIPLFLLPEYTTSPMPAEQMDFIFNNFTDYLNIFWNTLEIQRGFYITTMIGSLGLLDVPLPLITIFIYLIILLILPMTESEENRISINWKIKLSILLATLTGLISIITSLYIIWTSVTEGVGHEHITGVQGRYFIPLLFPILLCISNKKIKNKNFNKFINDNYIYTIIVLLIISIIMIIYRYWI